MHQYNFISTTTCLDHGTGAHGSRCVAILSLHRVSDASMQGIHAGYAFGMARGWQNITYNSEQHYQEVIQKQCKWQEAHK